jgi:hypothetical protein
MSNQPNARERFLRDSLNKSKQFFAGLLALWLGCTSHVTTRHRVHEKPPANWTSPDAPCGKYDDIRNPVLGNIGVKIDASGPWADGFREALIFWNTVLAANFHEETRLNACTVRIIDGGPDILNKVIVARSQLVDKDRFRGEIAVRPGAATALSSAELYAIAVHEFGHMLGLKHNASSKSIMYFLDITGTEVLDGKDILDLSTHHKLRPAVVLKGFLPIEVVQPLRRGNPGHAGGARGCEVAIPNPMALTESRPGSLFVDAGRGNERIRESLLPEAASIGCGGPSLDSAPFQTFERPPEF